MSQFMGHVCFIYPKVVLFDGIYLRFLNLSNKNTCNWYLSHVTSKSASANLAYVTPCLKYPSNWLTLAMCSFTSIITLAVTCGSWGPQAALSPLSHPALSKAPAVPPPCRSCGLWYKLTPNTRLYHSHNSCTHCNARRSTEFYHKLSAK